MKDKVTEVQIVPLKPSNGLIGFASCLYDNSLYLGNMGIYTSPSTEDGFRLTYPYITLPNGKKISAYYPINRETGQLINKAIVSHVEKVMKINSEEVSDGNRTI